MHYLFNFRRGLLILLPFVITVRERSACRSFLPEVKGYCSPTGGILFYEATRGQRVAGVLTYYIPSIGKTLAVRWSSSSSDVSRAYGSENSWNIRLYQGDSKADSYKFKDLSHNQVPYKADVWKVLSSGLNVRGYMSPFFLVIHVSS